MIDGCLPGTGGMVPLENRWLTCCWIEYQGSATLIDCGEGTQIALKKAGCKISRLDNLLITHFHADHIAGLPGLLLTLGNNGKTTELNIVGGAGLAYVVDALRIIAPALPYPVNLIELSNVQPSTITYKDVSISSLPLRHTLPCLGYRWSLSRKPVFAPQKAETLRIPKTLYRKLHSGCSVTLDDGRTIEPEMVLSGLRAPITVCYCTDTQPFDEMVDFVSGADLFIGEGMYFDSAMQDKMDEKGHMLFSDSAKIAKRANVKHLWLTHFSPALTNPRQGTDEVCRIFPFTSVAYDGIRTSL